MHTITHPEAKLEYVGEVILGVVALVPLVGAVKHIDTVSKVADDVGDAGKILNKSGDLADTLQDGRRIKNGLENISNPTAIKQGANSVNAPKPKVPTNRADDVLGNSNSVTNYSNTANKSGSEFLKELISKGRVKGKNIMSDIDDDYLLIVRRDIGKEAYGLPEGEFLNEYTGKIDHYNIEIQKINKYKRNKPIANYHIVVDIKDNGELKVVDADILKDQFLKNGFIE